MNNELVHKKKQPNFQPPTLEEVQFQFQAKGCSDPIEPDQFYAYYESNGWYVGRAKMRSWRAAVAGWVLRINKQKRTHDTPTDYSKFFRG